jgi:precorrin-2 dehydrogenase/sirohydrochlorin ferrochelatase
VKTAPSGVDVAATVHWQFVEIPLHFPVSLRLAGRRVLVVGDGELANSRKALLERAGALVRLLAFDAFQAADEPSSTDVALVFACSDDASHNRLVAERARARGVWVNAHDDPECSDFAMPAVVVRAPLVIAVSTSGESPALAARIRSELDAQFGDEYVAFLGVAGAARRYLQKHEPSAQRRAGQLNALAESALLSCLRNGDRAGCQAALQAVLGPHPTLEELERT